MGQSGQTLAETATSSGMTDDLMVQGTEKETLSSKTPTDEEEEPTDSSGSGKTLKKPDKIVPCPRCNSMDTKFCYFNNYNVNQPRHFCKNCQRYWTAGGVMRNVPVGSGRRKNKSISAPNYYQHIVNGSHYPSMKPTGFVVFGSDTPLDETRNHKMKLDDRTQECMPIGFTTSAPQVAFYPPTPYWGCPIPSPWNVPQAPPMSSMLGKHSRQGTMLRPTNSEKDNLSEKASPVLIPKTLRIHDPSDAAKSSIWSTLGIKNERVGSANGTSLFKAFVAKGDRNSNISNASLVYQANPAAFSRSLNFQESA